jgi:hypothetical protein
MPATLILLPALGIALVSWIAAWLYTRNSANHSSVDELQRLRNHAAWLEQRLDTARQERWGHEMIVSLSDQLGTACEQLARAQGRMRTRTTAPAR